MSDVTLSKDVRSVIKICVSANMMPVDTFKFISRGTTNKQRSLVYRWNNKFTNVETGVEDSMPHFHRILYHLIFRSFQWKLELLGKRLTDLDQLRTEVRTIIRSNKKT